MPDGVLGIDLFFALGAYLITESLHRDKAECEALTYAAFLALVGFPVASVR